MHKEFGDGDTPYGQTTCPKKLTSIPPPLHSEESITWKTFLIEISLGDQSHPTQVAWYV